MIDGRRIACLLVLAAATASRAEDPAVEPAPRTNKVSLAAQAAMDAYQKLVYRPAEHGLVSATGVFVRDGDDASLAVKFVLASSGRVATGGDIGAMSPRTPSLVRVLGDLPLRAGLEGMPMTESAEFDADLVERDGARVVVVTTRRSGTDNPTSEFRLDAEGLVASWKRFPSRATDAEHWFETTAWFTWEKVGERRRVARIKLSGRDSSRTVFRVAYSLAYGEVAGMQVPVWWRETITTADRSRETEFRVDELTINGRAYDVPRPPSAGHVTTEATELLERAVRLVRRPGDHGVRSMTATIRPEWAPRCGPARIELAAGHRLSISFPEMPNPPRPEAGVAAESLRRMLLPAFEGARPMWSKDYDAVVQERDGRKVVVVTDLGESDQQRECEVRIDAAGLVESTRDRTGPDPADPRSDATFRYVWEKSGDAHRLASMQFASMVIRGQKRDAPASQTYSFQYQMVAGADVLRSFTVTHEGRPTQTYRLEDLVVNGNRVDPVPDDGKK